MNMRAVVMEQTGGPLDVVDVPRPECAPDSVIVRVRATGLCRSDWHAWAGHDDIHLPHVPGHEFSGVVDAVGAAVTSWNVGDRVTMPFVEGCGRCAWCRSGQAQVCPNQEQPGFTHWGSFAQFVECRHADVNLVRLPESVSFAAAAALGCRFATAYRALTARAHLMADEWVCVVGAGGVGLSAITIAKSLGAHVVAVDRQSAALDAAIGEGADATVLADGRDVAAVVHEITSGGAHLALDAVGSESTCADAITSLRRRGRHIQVGLLPAVEGRPKVPMDRVIAWELDVSGSHGMAAVDYPPMLTQVASGQLDPARLVARTVPLERAAAMLPTFDTSLLAGITIIDPWL